MEVEIIEKLKRKRGYNDGRIKPYPFDQTHLIEEVFIAVTTAKQTLKGLREEKSEKYRLFATPELAAAALEDWIHRFEIVQ